MTFILENWLALLSVLAGVGLFTAAGITRWRSGVWFWPLYLPAAMLFSFGVGAFDFMPDWLSLTLFFATAAFFILALVMVFLTGFWSAPLGYSLACLFFFAFGACTATSIMEGLSVAWTFLISIRVQEPWWLLLFLLIPVLFWTSYQQLISLGEYRRWIVLGLRTLLIVCLALALAEVFARKPNENVTVIFVWDRSLSIAPEFQMGRDLREERIYDFINQSVALRSSKHANDQIGVIVFGKQPRLELPPNTVPKLGFKKVLSQLDGSYTDIGGAVKLALASFPEGSAKRIVLISDGNENMGRVEEEARVAKQNGVQIDVVPIATGQTKQNEILIERIEAPPITDKDARVPIRVVVRSYHPDTVVANLTLRKVAFDPKDTGNQNSHTTKVKLHQGLNVYYFQQAGAKEDTVFAYEATIVPLGVETRTGFSKDLPGDRVDNNTARVAVMSRGERAILLLEPRENDEMSVTHKLLVDRLREMKASLKVVALSPEQMRARFTKGDTERLATFLSKFDAVILANVPADMIPPEEQAVIRSHIHDQGAGLVMIGGHQSFGAGGWQNTEIEKALPVNMELKAMKVEGKSGLVLIMHASEMAEGNAWQRKIAKLAIEKLSPMDMVGQIHYDHGFGGGAPGHRWHLPFQEIGDKRKRLIAIADRMEPGDMPDVDPAFALAHKELTNPEYALGTKHIILISDGDHWSTQGWPARLKASKVTCTTVCITTHGQAEIKKMAAVAIAAGGRHYHITDPKELPAIYIKETRLVSQSFVHEKPFQPLLGPDIREGPTEGMKGALPDLHGFVRTTKRDSPLVKVLIETPPIGVEKDKYRFPILAAWQYGLGKSVAFTSDARTTKDGKPFWDRDWANDEMYAKFWDQTMGWVLRPTESGKHLFLTTEHKDGKIKITVEAQDADKMPLTDVKIKAGITSPTFKVKDDKKFELRFEQKNAGVYEAEISADEVGAYFINIHAEWDRVERDKNGKITRVPMTDTVRTGVTIPYSPEFAEMESNPGLLTKISSETGGRVYEDRREVLKDAAERSEVFRSVPQSHASLQAFWPWMVFLTALCLLFDVAIRRIAIQPETVLAKATTTWHRWRGQAVADDITPEYIERLKSRKASVGETMDKKKAAKKFEKSGASPVADAPIIASLAPTEKPKPAPAKEKPKAESKEEDFATRLMRAKKKAMEERDKDKPT